MTTWCCKGAGLLNSQILHEPGICCAVRLGMGKLNCNMCRLLAGASLALLLDRRINLKHSMLFYSMVVTLGALTAPLAASASQFQLPEEIGRIEGARDLNLIQLEPTMIDERYYTSGRCERTQHVGNILPVGAEIPDSDPAPVKASVQTVPNRAIAPAVVPAKAPAASSK